MSPERVESTQDGGGQYDADSDGNGLLFDLNEVGSSEPVFVVIEGSGNSSGEIVDLAEYNPTPDDLLNLLKELREIIETEFEEYRRQMQQKDPNIKITWRDFFANLEGSNGQAAAVLFKIYRAEELLGFHSRFLESRKLFDRTIRKLQQADYESLKAKSELELFIEELEALYRRYRTLYERDEDRIDATANHRSEVIDWDKISEDAWNRALREIDQDVLGGQVSDFITERVRSGELTYLNIETTIQKLREELEKGLENES